ncbi:MAG: ABC transporter ATP-binding protein [Thermaerobacter sp.]
MSDPVTAAVQPSPSPQRREPGREPVIRTSALTRRYDEVTAVDALDLEIYEGEIFGLLGPNGAGKTTTILMLLGLTEPTSGQAAVLGRDPTREPLEIKRLTGYLPDNVGFYDHMTGRENLRYTARLNGIPDAEAEVRIERLLEQVGLTEAADRRVGGYSRGMRQRLGLADVLIKEPRLVILDEPTTGLDPEGAAELLRLITELRDRHGVTVMLSSHQLQQVQQICDRVGIFVGGRLIACGPIDTLARQIFGDAPLLEVECAPVDDGALSAVRGVDGVLEIDREGPRLLVRAERDVRPEVAAALVKAGYRLLRLDLRSHSLEEIYRRYFREGSRHGDDADGGNRRRAR